MDLSDLSLEKQVAYRSFCDRTEGLSRDEALELLRLQYLHNLVMRQTVTDIARDGMGKAMSAALDQMPDLGA